MKTHVYDSVQVPSKILFGDLSLVVSREWPAFSKYKDLEKTFFLPIAPAYDQVLLVASTKPRWTNSYEDVVAQIATSTEIENIPVSLSKDILETDEIEFAEEREESICRGSLLVLLKSILPLRAKNLKIIHPSSRFQLFQDRARIILCHWKIETGYIT